MNLPNRANSSFAILIPVKLTIVDQKISDEKSPMSIEEVAGKDTYIYTYNIHIYTVSQWPGDGKHSFEVWMNL